MRRQIPARLIAVAIAAGSMMLIPFSIPANAADGRRELHEARFSPTDHGEGCLDEQEHGLGLYATRGDGWYR